MRIAITGGAGFIGSHLCEQLLREGHEIFCIDNFYTGNNDNIKYIASNSNFHLILADISKPINFCSNLDQIWNLACPASPIHYQRDPVQTIKTNVFGTMQMLDLAKQTGAKFIQASTSEVYGDPAVHPQPEEYWGNVNPAGIRSCYDEGKRCAETLCFDYYRQYGVDIKVVRIFNTYGPRMDIDDGRVVSNFIIQALNDQDITIYGDGSQTRSFQYVDDLISGMILFAKSNLRGPINIGNPEEYTISELAIFIKELCNSKSKIVYKDLPEDDPKQRKPDISKMNKLGWQPTWSVKDGLVRTISHFEARIRASHDHSN